MSVDTRTPRTPTGDRSSGFDDAPALSMVKVPCDPAQVIVNHASFRVQLPTERQARSPRIARHLGSAQDTARIPVVGARRRAPVVWSGRSAPGDPGASGLLQAVRNTGVRHAGDGAPVSRGAATQVIPRIGFDEDATVGTPGVTETRRTPILPQQLRTAGSAFEEAPYNLPYDDGSYGDASYDDEFGPGGPGDEDAYDLDSVRVRRHGNDPVRHAYYPGRRMNLGVVLLPLRVFLGFISIYAGMGKLCDPVYFDGGERGSMVKWLHSLHPWALAEPLREFALQHPVGAGLSVAFLQVIVGVLTVLGLWQRVAAVIGALLSAALIVTVSWRTLPAYDAPDIIYLAAWSPLIIAGAPVYSVDGRLASEAWRTLGPRAELWELRRRVLRRGTIVSAIAVGVTLLVGSLLGGAVRDADRVTVPGPGEAPRNEIPGSPLPQEPGRRHSGSTSGPSASGTPTQGQSGSAGPSRSADTPGASRATGSVSAGQPTQGAGQGVPQHSAAPQAPSTTSGPAAGGTSSPGGAAASGGTGGGSATGGSGSGSGSGGNGDSNGLVGGLLG
ncbi:DoxX family membrane protein [Streptomyces sp. NPDC002004]